MTKLKAGEQHEYQVSLAAGDFIHLVVEQVSVNSVVEMFGPTGKKLVGVDSPNGTQGPEPLFWLAEDAGTYRVRVRALEETARAGRYVARLVEVRVGRPRDKLFIAATDAMREAEWLHAQGTPETLRRAVQKYEGAAVRWREFGDQARDAEVRHKQVAALVASNLLQEALPPARRALDLLFEAHGPGGTAVLPALFVLADVHLRRSEFTEAQALYKRALKILEKSAAASAPAAAEAHFGICRAHLGRNAAAVALAAYERGLKIYEKNSGVESLAYLNALSGLVRIYDVLGKGDRARDLLRRVTEALSKKGSEVTPELSAVLFAVGNVAAGSGDLVTAQTLFEQLVGVNEKLYGAESPLVAAALVNLGRILSTQTKYAEARAAYESARKIYAGAYGEDRPCCKSRIQVN